MKDYLDIIQKRFRNETDFDAETILESTIKNALFDGLPSLDFLRDSRLDSEGVVSGNLTKNVRINGKSGQLSEFNVVGNNVRIVKFSDEFSSGDTVEIYHEDDLVFRASGSREWVSLKAYGIDDGDLIWNIDNVELFSRGIWEMDLKKLYLCQEEEVNSWKDQDSSNGSEAAKISTQRKFSELKIEE